MSNSFRQILHICCDIIGAVLEMRECFMIIEEHRMTQLGYALREYRVRHNMTQQDLAEQLGVSTNTIHLWETRVCKPSMGSLLLLSDLLDMPLLDIISKSKQRF